MATKMSTMDKLLFFFSGHGSNSTNNVYICPYDTSPFDDPQTNVIDPSSLINKNELHNLFAQLPNPQNIICIFDSCYSGGMATSGNTISDTDLNKYTVLMACSETQYSWETDELENGVFTYYLTYAFNRANSPDIDLNGNKIVSAEEAFAYAKMQVAYVEKAQMHDPSTNQFEITPPDTTAPNVTSVNPSNNAININPEKDIVVTFSENIIQGTNFNNITLTNNNTPLNIALSLSGNQLTITHNNLSTGTYTLNIPLNAITDQAENTLTTPYTTTFTVDANNPNVSTTVTSGVYRINKTVALFMNESGTIYYTMNGSTPTTSSKKYSSPLVISCNMLLRYFALDLAGNRSSIYSQKYTIDKISPLISSTIPTHQSTDYSKTASIYIKFSEKIFASTYWNLIKVKNLSTNSFVSINKSISNNILIIKTTSSRIRWTWYIATIPIAAVKDIAGNKLAASYTFRFKTGN
jgi:hypothetical protein